MSLASPRNSELTVHAIARALLQVSHRIGAVALLATLGMWAMMYRMQNFHWPLAIAAGASDIGLCAALLARLFLRPSDSLNRQTVNLRREANGVAIFNLVLFILAIYFMVFARLSVIRTEAADFFTPTMQQSQ